MYMCTIVLLLQYSNNEQYRRMDDLTDMSKKATEHLQQSVCEAADVTDDDHTDDEVGSIYKENNTDAAEGAVRWPEDIRTFSKKIWKNVCMVGVIYCLIFTSFIGLADLQSSLFIDQGMGVICQSIVYTVFAVSSLLIPKVLLKTFGHKWTMVVSLCGYVLWMAANGYATWVTMPLASAIVGISAAPLWTAHGSYINTLAVQYSLKNGKDLASTTSLLFGVSFGIFKIAKLMGSILSWAVLQTTWRNSSAVNDHELELCGSNDCPWFNSTNINYDKPPAKLIWTLVGVFLGIAATAIILLILLLDPLPPAWYRGKPKQSKGSEVLQAVTSAAILHANHRLLLLIPYFIHTGMIQTVILAEFNKSYITCSLGVWMVGLVSITYPVISSITSLASGQMAKKTGRSPQIILGLLIDIGVLVFFLLWQPNPDRLALYFIISGVLGLSDGISHAQLSTVIGLLFPGEEASYANFRLWQSVGYAIAFGTNTVLCVRHKLYLLIGVATLSVICYATLVVVERNRKLKSRKAHKSSTEDVDDQETIS